MQQGSLYYHFPSKDAALAEVCRVGVEGFVDGLEEVIASDLPAEAKIRAAVANHLRGLHDRRDYIRTFLFSRHNLPKDLRQEVTRLSRLYESRLETLFRDNQKDGTVRADLDCRLAVLGFLGMCNAAAVSHRPDPKIPLDAYVESFANLFLHGVMAKG
jgi:AcrR family transcriptional regulator